jgi:hypothetical protein
LVPDQAISKYLRLHQSPFDNDTVGLPVFPSPPSSKVTGWITGVAAAGTAGFGFIACRPVITNDTQAIFSSGPTYTGTSCAGAGTGVTATTVANLPFPASDLSEANSLRGRAVCCALRIRYIDQSQRLGGVMYPYVDPAHQDLISANVTAITQREEYKSFQVSRAWTTIMWSPVHRAEMDYYHTANPPAHSGVDDATGAVPMAILFNTTAGNIFEWQYIVHNEYIGTKVGMTKTENPASSGFVDVIDRLQDPKHSLRGTGNPGAMRDLRPLIETLGPIAIGAAKAWMGREDLR